MRKIFCFLLLASCLIMANSAVAQEVKLRNKGDTCNSSNEGAMYYDNADDTFYLCRTAASGWEAFEDLAPASGGASLPPGSIDWSDCEYKNLCTANSDPDSSTLSCTSGKVMVDSTCFGMGSIPNSISDRYLCYMSGTDRLYVRSYNYSNGFSVCGSIKCCTLVTG